MKIGIVGTGVVGCACALAAAIRGSAREIVLVNCTRRTAEAVADRHPLRHAALPQGRNCRWRLRLLLPGPLWS